MEEILARQLHFSISQRYPRPSDMQADLAALLATAFLQQEKLSMPIAVRRPAQSHLSAKQLRAWSRTRTLLHMSTIGLCGLLALIALFVPLLLSILTPAIQTKKLQEAMALLAAEEQLIFSSKKVGLSDGRFIFDTYDGRGNVALKQQGGQALQQGDLASAVNFFSQAVAVDPTDGEAQIHNENIHVLQRGSPYLTIVLGLAFDQKNPENLISARVDTQAAFVAQHLINKNGLLPRGLQLRILIANSGSDRADVATVAQLVANRVSKAGNPDNFVAVVGWPFSSQTINARDIIASVRLPLVSQTSSSVQLSGSSPYFFRVNPADDLQGEALGEVAVQQLKAKKILVLRDPLDSYSISLADAFSASVKELGAQAINNRTHYFIESVTSVSEFQKIVNDGISQKVDLFFIAGFSVDGVRLAHALGNAVRADPLNKALPKLKILGGDGLSTGLVLGEGDGPDAQIARKFPQDMQRLIFSAFGTSGVWDFIGIPKGQQSAFIADWISFYQSSGIDTNNTSSPGNDAILTADAVLIIVEAVSLVQGTVTGQAVRDALVSLGKGGVSAYQGISGRIVFDAQGDPIDKAMVILFVERNDKGKGNVIKLRQVVGTFS
jgi:ABC-type branched-subunit amino acid transport system substrate-binding protein